ncbi:MAG TPA: hypothetical protein VEK33_25730 [Terriglobales bacterium]|nr:hypothetical protein [Terriglobales bacterium]
MQLTSVPLARVLGFLEMTELNPRGTVFFPELLDKVIERFDFQKYPSPEQQLDLQKGVELFEGRWNGVNVSKLAIFDGALIVDTSTSTADSERIMEEALQWSASELGLNYRPGMIRRKQYLNDIVFYSDIRLLAIHPAFVNLQNAVTDAGERYLWQRREYDFTHFSIDFDHTLTPLVAAPFSIQRRGNTLFSDNKYFSEAPFPTDVHINIVERLEADLTS